MNKLTILGLSGIIFGALLYWDAKRKPKASPEDIEAAKKQWKSENEFIGRELGYPQCCINEFCAQPPLVLKTSGTSLSDEERLKAAHLNGKYTGFIPCKRHAQLILDKKITLESLITDRNTIYPPFPQV